MQVFRAVARPGGSLLAGKAGGIVPEGRGPARRASPRSSCSLHLRTHRLRRRTGGKASPATERRTTPAGAARSARRTRARACRAAGRAARRPEARSRHRGAATRWSPPFSRQSIGISTSSTNGGWPLVPARPHDARGRRRRARRHPASAPADQRRLARARPRPTTTTPSMRSSPTPCAASSAATACARRAASSDRPIRRST